MPDDATPPADLTFDRREMADLIVGLGDVLFAFACAIELTGNVTRTRSRVHSRTLRQREQRDGPNRYATSALPRILHAAFSHPVFQGKVN